MYHFVCNCTSFKFTAAFLDMHHFADLLQDSLHVSVITKLIYNLRFRKYIHHTAVSLKIISSSDIYLLSFKSAADLPIGQLCINPRQLTASGWFFFLSDKLVTNNCCYRHSIYFHQVSVQEPQIYHCFHRSVACSEHRKTLNAQIEA